jgi:hypothetical protein
MLFLFRLKTDKGIDFQLYHQKNKNFLIEGVIRVSLIAKKLSMLPH